MSPSAGRAPRNVKDGAPVMFGDAPRRKMVYHNIYGMLRRIGLDSDHVWTE